MKNQLQSLSANHQIADLASSTDSPISLEKNNGFCRYEILLSIISRILTAVCVLQRTSSASGPVA